MQTAAEIAAELTVLYAARTKLAAGERVEDVWRNGRRMKFTAMTLPQINEAIQQREVDLEQAQAAEAGGSRRQDIGT